MIPIVIYAGGNIITGSTYIDYNNPLKFLFLKMKIRVLTRSELRYIDSSDY
jgi:hypothetical protein